MRRRILRRRLTVTESALLALFAGPSLSGFVHSSTSETRWSVSAQSRPLQVVPGPGRGPLRYGLSLREAPCRASHAHLVQRAEPWRWSRLLALESRARGTRCWRPGRFPVDPVGWSTSTLHTTKPNWRSCSAASQVVARSVKTPGVTERCGVSDRKVLFALPVAVGLQP